MADSIDNIFQFNFEKGKLFIELLWGINYILNVIIIFFCYS